VSWHLTREAEADIIDIYRYGARTFGTALADAYHDRLEKTFDLLAAFPEMARERAELDPPMRVHACNPHIIIYTTAPDGSIQIIRVRHGREDWTSSGGD
jgi:toxin ParE1/3/4